jgi:hypothetical protein
MPATASWTAVAASLLGYRTASGKILDTVTGTAAHRSLPLASFAKAGAAARTADPGAAGAGRNVKA